MLCTYVYIHTHTYIHTYTYTHTPIYIYIYIYMHTHAHAHIPTISDKNDTACCSTSPTKAPGSRCSTQRSRLSAPRRSSVRSSRDPRRARVLAARADMSSAWADARELAPSKFFFWRFEVSVRRFLYTFPLLCAVYLAMGRKKITLTCWPRC